MAIHAKFNGTCATCGEPISVGDPIERVTAKGTAGLSFAHSRCKAQSHVPNTSPSVEPVAVHRQAGAGNTFRPGSMAYHLTECFLNGLSESDAFTVLASMRDGGAESLTFKRNDKVTGRRVNLPDYQQNEKLRNAIRKQYRTLRMAGSLPMPTVTEPNTDPEPEPSVTVKAHGDTWLLEKIRQARQIAEEREIDSIGYRPVIEGKRMADAGIDPASILHSMVINWPDDCRAQLGLVTPKPFTHTEAMDRLKTLATLGIPIYLKGEAGFGKSHMAKDLAREMFGSLDWYGETPMSAGASPSWLAGAWTVDTEEPFKTRDFLERYGSGGVFVFEEIDRADANLLTFLNNAIAGEAFRNPVSGKTVVKATGDKPFVAVATANTWGTGADTRYVGAEALDFSTRDRFRMGRMVIGYDQSLEDSLWNNA